MKSDGKLCICDYGLKLFALDENKEMLYVNVLYNSLLLNEPIFW